MNRYCCHCLNPVSETDRICSVCGKPVDIAVPFHHLPTGTILQERYYIGAALGQGGFGITYAAYDINEGRKVAVKEYYPNGFVNRNNTRSASVVSSSNPSDEALFAKGRQRFLEEASILSKFSGVDGVVDVLDCFKENNTVYIVMEFLEGVSLKQYLQNNGKLSVDRTFNMLMPVMNALREIHREELIHRDISPDNIMLTQQNGELRVKLIDFGAARHFSSKSNKSLTVVLKPGFAPIEQYGSKDEQGAWTDVYALCATIYKCITGVTPEPSPDRVQDDHLTPPSQLGVEIEPKTERVIMKGLSVDADDRYQTVDAMLRALLTDDDEQAQSAGKQEPPQSGPKKEGSSQDGRSLRRISRSGTDDENGSDDGSRAAGGKKRNLIAVFTAAAAVIAVVVIAIVILPKVKKSTAAVSTTDTVSDSGSADVTQADDAAADVSGEDAGGEEDPAASLVSENFIDPVNGWNEYDQLISRIKAETDSAKRTEMMRQAEDILMSGYCVVPLYYYSDYYMQKEYVNGVYCSPFGVKHFLYAALGNGSDTLRLNLASEPETLDPALVSYLDGACLTANTFAGLYAYDENGKTVPACAEGYTVSGDGLTYTVRLKKGLKWSDGSDLTAADFAYSWRRAADPATGAAYAYLFSGFEGYGTADGINVKASDDAALTFVLTAPCAYMEDLMAFTTFCPVKKEAVEAAAGWQTDPGAWCGEAGFVSNGAYVCTGWSHDSSMTYEKNPYFYNAGKVSIARQEYMLSSDASVIAAAYHDGRLDFTDSAGGSSDNYESRQANDPELHMTDILGTFYMAFNAGSKLFEGKTPAQAACMREAFSLLIDRDEICENVGLPVRTAADTFIPRGMADGSGGVFRAEGDAGYYDAHAIRSDREAALAKARGLLEAAGFVFGDDGKLSADNPIDIDFLTLTNDDSGNKLIADMIKKDFEEIGVRMTVRIQDQNVVLEEQKAGNFDIVRGGWVADFNDPVNMLELWTTSSGNNVCRFGRHDGGDA